MSRADLGPPGSAADPVLWCSHQARQARPRPGSPIKSRCRGLVPWRVMRPIARSSHMTAEGMRALGDIWASLAGPPPVLDNVSVTGEGALPSVYRVTDLA